MIGQHRHLERSGGNVFHHGQFGILLGEFRHVEPLGNEGFRVWQTLKQFVSFLFQTIAGASGVDQCRRVGQYGQSRRLAPREFVRRGVEITPRRRVDAHHVAPKGRVGGIKVEDAPLGVMQLQPHGQNDFKQFLAVGPRWVVARHAHHLHRDRAAAAHHLPCPHIVAKRLDKRNRIEAPVQEKPAVFVFQEAGRVFR